VRRDVNDPLPIMQTALDLQDQDIPTPAVFEGGAKVPLSRGTVLDPVQDSDIVSPGQFCNELLQNLLVGPGLGQRTHVAEVPRVEPFDRRELSLQIPSEPVDNLAAPLLSRKPLAQIDPDRSTTSYSPRLSFTAISISCSEPR